jgi:aminopeptidase N
MHFLRVSTLTLLLAAVIVSCHRKTTGDKATQLNKPKEPNEYVESKPLIGEPQDSSMLEYNLMDPIDIVPGVVLNPDSLKPYNASHTFKHDLLHTKIEISFDWVKKHANATATLTLKPWFYATSSLTLDAKNFDIHSVTLVPSRAPLKYTYNNEQITIQLDKLYTRKEEFSVAIDYTAKPDDRESFGGSAAITSDKGLYFINADGSEAGKPKQIWTQGETESNSFWFPTIDKPNERCTQEMYITVADNYKTLSNGVMLSSTKNIDGTRTDYWKMDKPHAPYLFMMAIGEFAVVKDQWKGKDVLYYVEPKYEQYARDIFPNTPELLSFFSEKLGYDYPWSKFAQVVVRDYVSGAMENTTSVIFGDYVQKTKRELLDDHFTNEKVVAHEMFHHWFGDLVTTENWANLTLNEGFANYSEYLWMEHQYGKEVADKHLEDEQAGYMYSATDGGHPLINFGFDRREDMFDAHSYNKGGSILHMLRNYVGDDAFFTALRTYLKRNEYSDVEAHELRLAFEDVTGQDLNWFFNQWFFASGHPSLDITYNWNDSASATEVTIEQQQVAENGVPYVFDIPMAVDVYDASGNVHREEIRLTKRKQTFAIKSAQKPALLNVDADKTLLSVKTDHHSREEWVYLFEHGPLYRDRIEALNALSAESAIPETVLIKALKDQSPDIRQFALRAMETPAAGAVEDVAHIASDEKEEPPVRCSAMALLSRTGDLKYLPVFEKGLVGEQAYSVVGASLSALMSLNPESAVKASKALENEDSDAIITSLSELYAANPKADQLPWFSKHAAKIDLFPAFGFFEQYQQFLIKLNDNAALEEGIASWKSFALTPAGNSEWRRFAATKALADTRNFLKEKGDTAKADAIDVMIAEIKEKETDETLKMYYGMF